MKDYPVIENFHQEPNKLKVLFNLMQIEINLKKEIKLPFLSF